MPYLEEMDFHNHTNTLVLDELRYNKSLLALEHQRCVNCLNSNQKLLYDSIMQCIELGRNRVFFIYGHGGTGKTFIWRTLSATLRSKGEIVLNGASSGVASLHHPSGRTTHSHFAIPLVIDADSICNIKQGSHLAELLVKTKLIIWDEAFMMNKYSFEAFNRSSHDLLRFSNPKSFEEREKVVVFKGDFIQTLPVISKGSREDIVFATINSSYLWNFCKVLRLSKNMRLRQDLSLHKSNKLKEFVEWILKVSDDVAGKANDGEGIV